MQTTKKVTEENELGTVETLYNPSDEQSANQLKEGKSKAMQCLEECDQFILITRNKSGMNATTIVGGESVHKFLIVMMDLSRALVK